MYSLPKELREHVQFALQPGEQVVWAAQPIVSLVNRLTIPYFFFLAFALVFYAVFFTVAGWLFAMFPLMFVAIIAWTIWHHYYRMKHSVYVLTEHRALVVRPGARKSWQTIAWPLTADLIKERELRADGSGDLIFGYENNSSRNEGGNAAVPMGFFSVPELRCVEQLLLAVSAKDKESV